MDSIPLGYMGSGDGVSGRMEKTEAGHPRVIDSLTVNHLTIALIDSQIIVW